MSNVILYGVLSVLPLMIGAFIGAYLKISEKILGVVAAFGAGAMIAALTFGLMEESFYLGGFDNAIIGFIAGGLAFAVGDYLIIKIGGRGHKRSYETKFKTGWGMVLGAVLDGIPEAVALGVSLFLSPFVGLLVLAGIILNNFPEALASAYDLKRIEKRKSHVIMTWLLVSIVIFIFVILGYLILSGLSPDIIATIQAIAAGAILAMLAVTMMPEAYKESGLGASIATVLGFIVIFVLAKSGV